MAKNNKGNKPIPSVYTRLRESSVAQHIFGTPKKPADIKETKTLVLGAVEQSYGIYQIPSFRDQVTTFWDDPVLKEGVTMFAEQVVATGYFLTSNSKYTFTINGRTALDVIKEWCDVNNIRIKIIEIAIELKAFGNSVWRITDLGFVKIPIEAVWHGVRVDPLIPLQEQYHLQLVPIYGGKIVEWKEFIHFRIGTTGYHAPFGQGVIYSLLMKPKDSIGNVAPSVYDIRLGMRASLHEGFRKFSFGNVWVGMPNLSNEDFEEQKLAEKVAKMSSTGNRIVTNSDIKVELEVPERTQSYDKFIKQMNDEFFMSLADPSLKLGLEQGFTKATAITASEVYKYKISSMRRAIKEQFEDLFVQILNKLGYNGIQAKVEMNFGPEEIAEYKVVDILAAVNAKVPIITVEEARLLLSKYCKWDITGKMEGNNEIAPEPPKVDNKTQTPEETNKKFKEAMNNMRKASKKGIESGNGVDVIITKLKDNIAGISEDGKTVYIDEIVKDMDNMDAKEDEKYPHELLVSHRLYEYHLIKDDNKSHEEAHELAAQHEHDIADYKGLDWEKLTNIHKGLLVKVKERGSEDPNDICKGVDK